MKQTTIDTRYNALCLKLDKVNNVIFTLDARRENGTVFTDAMENEYNFALGLKEYIQEKMSELKY